MVATSPPDKPIGVIDAIAYGFELVTSRLDLAVWPLLLDLVLWVGPQVSIEPLVMRVLEATPVVAAGMEGVSEAQVREVWQAFGATYDVMAALAVGPLGAPTMRFGAFGMPFGIGSVQVVPGGVVSKAGWLPAIYVDSPLMLLGLLALFSALGLLVGVLYFVGIARVVARAWLGEMDGAAVLGSGPLRKRLRPSPGVSDRAAPTLPPPGMHLLSSGLKIVLFALGALGLLTAIFVPTFMAVSLLALSSPVLASLSVVLCISLVIWLGLYLVFVPHGITINGLGVLRAVWGSFRMVQWNLFGVLGLYALYYGISVGLGFIWALPEPDSWLYGVAIVVHAFIATGLTTATFVFYADRHRWWTANRQWMLDQLSEQRRRTDYARRLGGRDNDK